MLWNCAACARILLCLESVDICLPIFCVLFFLLDLGILHALINQRIPMISYLLLNHSVTDVSKIM